MQESGPGRDRVGGAEGDGRGGIGNAGPDLSLAQAQARVRETLPQPLPARMLALDEALGHVLAGDIDAPIDLPPFDNAAMDGYAFDGADFASAAVALPLDGRTLAGETADALLPGHARRITTGAMLPPGADRVVVQERVQLQEGVLCLQQLPPAGANIRRAGEDLRRGERVLARGTRLGPLQLALLAALGLQQVSVHRRPRVAVLSTGDELVEPGGSRRAGQIFDSNRFLMAALLERLGAEVVLASHCVDRREPLMRALETAAQVADLVVTSGGVSVGEADLLPELVARLGQVHLHKLALKPGRPVLYGAIAGVPLFGLPGNPVSVLVTCLKLVQPALQQLAGAPPRPPLQLQAQVEVAIDKRHARLEFQRGRMTQAGSGKLWVRPLPGQGSHQLATLREADCLIVLPEGPQRYAAGDTIEVEPLLQWLS